MSETKKEFLDAASAWLCGGYALDLGYVGGVQDGSFQIWGVAVRFFPLNVERNLSFSIQTDAIIAGQIQRHPVSKAEAMEFLRNAVDGTIPLPQGDLVLPPCTAFDYH